MEIFFVCFEPSLDYEIASEKKFAILWFRNVLNCASFYIFIYLNRIKIGIFVHWWIKFLILIFFI